MKILFVSDNFPPENNAPATRVWQHGRLWATAGEDVTIVTTAPNFPAGKIFDGYKNRRSEETLAGMTILRVPSFITANNGFALRVLDYLSFAASAFLHTLRRDCNVVVATSPQLFSAVAGRAIAAWKRVPWVMEVRDLWPESIVAVGAMRHGLAIRLLTRLELSLYHSAAGIIVVTEAFAENLTRRGIDPAKITVVPNGADVEVFQPRPRDEDLIRLWKAEGWYVLAFFGTLGMAHGLDFVLDCASELQDMRVKLVLMGDGACRAALQEQAAAMGLTNIVFEPPQPRDQMSRYLASCDASLVCLKKSTTFTTVIPSKIFEAGAMARPVVLGVEGEAMRLVQRFGAGVTFTPEDKPSFLSAVKRLKDDASLADRCRAGARELVAAYDRRTLALMALQAVQRAVTQARSP